MSHNDSWLLVTLWCAVVITFNLLIVSSFLSSKTPQNLAPAEISAKSTPTSISPHPEAPIVIDAIRDAAVRVESPARRGYGSGTYMRMHGELVVMTAAHVVEGHSTMRVHGRDGEMVIGKVIYADMANDSAVLWVPKMETRRPVLYRPIRNQNMVGAKVVYTGFPNDYDLLTIFGDVAGAVGSDNDRLIIHSYGWMGASGSGAFDLHGRFVGVVVAVDVGVYMLPQIVEDIVWIMPVWQMDQGMMALRVELESLAERPKSFPGAAAPRRGGLRD